MKDVIIMMFRNSPQSSFRRNCTFNSVFISVQIYLLKSCRQAEIYDLEFTTNKPTAYYLFPCFFLNVLVPGKKCLLKKLIVIQLVKNYLMWNQKFYSFVDKSPSLVPILSQVSPFHTLFL